MCLRDNVFVTLAAVCKQTGGHEIEARPLRPARECINKSHQSISAAVAAAVPDDRPPLRAGKNRPVGYLFGRANSQHLAAV